MVRDYIGKPTGDIYPSDLERLTRLMAFDKGIIDLTGLEYCTNLTELNLRDNQISNITPLGNLTNLTTLGLSVNQISDISLLSNLTSLTELWLNYNQISDISPLSNLINLTRLYLSGPQMWCRMAIVDTKAFMSPAPRHSISVHTSLAINGLVWAATSAGYRKSRYTL